MPIRDISRLGKPLAFSIFFVVVIFNNLARESIAKQNNQYQHKIQTKGLNL